MFDTDIGMYSLKHRAAIIKRISFQDKSEYHPGVVTGTSEKYKKFLQSLYLVEAKLFKLDISQRLNELIRDDVQDSNRRLLPSYILQAIEKNPDFCVFKKGDVIVQGEVRLAVNPWKILTQGLTEKSSTYGKVSLDIVVVLQHTVEFDKKVEIIVHPRLITLGEIQLIPLI